MSVYHVGTDIGGTFTDCVIVDEQGSITTGKSPSTPDDFSRGFFDSIGTAAEKLGLDLDGLFASAQILVHSTTAATNAVVERRGARVGLIATRGHGEAILIMRGGGRSKGREVDDLLQIHRTYKPDPLVPAKMIREVTERIDCHGDVIVKLDEDDVRAAVRDLATQQVDAVAISLLWGFLNPAHERRVREIVEDEAPELFVSCSHEISPTIGEYYRTVGTAINAYIGPLMSSYVGRLADGASDQGYAKPVLFGQAVGGTIPVAEVKRRPLYTLDSGPVSGVVASTYLAQATGYRNVIGADMGGTTFDVSLIVDGEPRRRETTNLEGYELFLPMLDVQSIGAGGGSIARLDPASQTIKVGPQSAGADPGPVCYGRGGVEPTVTDADVVLGVINPERFLGGRRRLDRDAAFRSLEELGRGVGLSAEEAAAGVTQIVDNRMADKIHRLTAYGGYDVADFVIFAFGGASAAHAGAFARELGVRTVVIPLGNSASVLSALGTVCGDVAHIVDRSVRYVAPLGMDAIEAEFRELEEAATRQLVAEGFSPEEIELDRYVALKYGAQVFDLELPVAAGEGGEAIVARFERAYRERFGRDSGYAPAGIQLTRIRLQSRGRLPKPQIARGESARGEQLGTRQVWWSERGGYVETPIFAQLGPERVAGPLICELSDTTVVVRPGQTIERDAFGNLVLTALEG